MKSTLSKAVLILTTLALNSCGNDISVDVISKVPQATQTNPISTPNPNTITTTAPALPDNCGDKVTLKLAPWVKVPSVRFGFFQSFDRTQGVTSDGLGNFWFSGNTSLYRTGSNVEQNIVSLSEPFSPLLTALGASHIGDIDWHGQNIYASIQDGGKFQHPIVGIYDAASLTLKNSYFLPMAWQPDGVPWIAVDHAKKEILSSKFSDVQMINVYDLSSMGQLRQIKISTTLSGIQGGKVSGNYLYVTANDIGRTGFALFYINLQTGAVFKAFQFPDDVREIEGLVLTSSSSGCDLYVLAQTGSYLSIRMELYNYKK
ncbi:MAG: hypothetical protein H7177_00290 [Rhizobacter sp.]|nr:hypothetical protein [Bacteriovorax sp.]